MDSFALLSVKWQLCGLCVIGQYAVLGPWFFSCFIQPIVYFVHLLLLYRGMVLYVEFDDLYTDPWEVPAAPWILVEDNQSKAIPHFVQSCCSFDLPNWYTIGACGCARMLCEIPGGGLIEVEFVLAMPIYFATVLVETLRKQGRVREQVLNVDVVATFVALLARDGEQIWEVLWESHCCGYSTWCCWDCVCITACWKLRH